MAPKEDKKNVAPQPPAKSKPSKHLAAADDIHNDTEDFVKHHIRYSLFFMVYLLLDFVLLLVTLGVLGYSIYAMVAIPNVTAHEKGRIAGLVLLAVVELILAVFISYGPCLFRKKDLKKVSSVAVLSFLAVVAVLELAGFGIAVFVESQEQEFAQLLTKDFVQAKSNDQASQKFYHHLESSLKCCGVDGATDYGVPANNYAYPPEVSISCCPSYDPDLSDLEQNKARQFCKVNRSYYTQGCKGPATEKFKKILLPLFGLLGTSVFFVISLLALGLVAKFCSKKILQPNRDSNVAP